MRFPIRRSPFFPPQKALILKPCCMSQVMLATPLLAALSGSYSRTQFDWAVSGWARPVLATNPRLAQLVDTGQVGVGRVRPAEVRALVRRLGQEKYDTCFIPSQSLLLAMVAWLARIPQRVGLAGGARSLLLTMAVRPPAGERHAAEAYLALARALAITDEVRAEFFPRDIDRTTATQRLVDELDWLGETPLVVLHPGGGGNPARPDERLRWPVERFVLLGNYLARQRRACVALVGSADERPIAEGIAGLMSGPSHNLAGRISLGELGALCEVADLYVGNDAGPTHVAAAVGCPTLAIYGPSDPALSHPYCTRGKVVTLWKEQAEKEFSWANGVTAAEAIGAAEELLGERRG
jgi:lipopolysaccharide heptosyltransferase II